MQMPLKSVDNSPAVVDAQPVELPQGQDVAATYQQRIHQLENYFAHVPRAIMVTELDGQIMDVNPAACQLLGYSKEELLQMYPWDFVTSASCAEILELLNNLQHGVPATVQRHYQRKSGEQLVIDLRLARFAGEGRDMAIVSCHDVTEARRVEEQLRKSESLLAEGQRLTKTGSWVLDPKTGETDWSVEICRIFGFPDPPPSPHYSEFRARVHPDDRSAVDELLIESSKTGEPRLLQYLFVLPDGTRKHIETVSQPVFDENGVVVRLMGTVMDVTERHKAESDLRASEKLARGQMQALVRTLDAMAQESSPDRFLEHVLSTIIEQLNVDSISEWHQDLPKGPWSSEMIAESVQLQTPSGPTLKRTQFVMPLQDCPLWPLVRDTAKPVLCEDLAAYPDFPFKERMQAQGIVTVLGVPLLIAGEVAGLLGLRFYHKRELHHEEIELAQALAHQATLAIQLTRQAKQSRQSAVEAERNRFARDMHDTLAQGFTGVVVQLEAAEDAISKGLPQAADEHITRAGEMARYGLSEARRSVRALRPQLLEGNELCAALDQLIGQMSAGTNVEAKFLLQGQPQSLPAAWDEHLLRITQEAFTNTLRYANATYFSVRLAFSDDVLQLELSDNGRGFDISQKRPGFGLLGMKERLDEINGELEISSAPGQGTTISVMLNCVNTSQRDTEEDTD